MKLILRGYQQEAINALSLGFAKGHRAQMLYGACGVGKTEIAVAMMEAAKNRPRKDGRTFRSAMLVDLKMLCAQTSARLDKYGIDHGIHMPESYRWRPEESIQVCMVQTLEARELFPAVELLIVDEAHIMRKSVIEFIKSHPGVSVVGLSGSPFTKGLGATYTNVISGPSINTMAATEIENGNGRMCLIKPRIFIAKQIDMTGAKKVAGEWSDKEATARGIQITGDIVAEWIDKTHSIFGGPRKTIVFCSGVNHGNDLSQKFNEAGYNFVSVSYKDAPEYAKEVLAEFSKPDSTIVGLIATDMLSKGFDVADISIAISARPFSKSLSAHVQQLGRIMRPHEFKDECVWLCHSGNYLRFRDQWDCLCEDGVTELDDGAEKTKPEPTDKEKDASKCPVCHALWPAKSDVCSNCGHVRERRNDVSSVAGEMHELKAGAKSEKYDSATKERWYRELLGYARKYGKRDGFAYHKYREKFNLDPPWKKIGEEPSLEVFNWVKNRNIAFVRGSQKNV